MRLLVTTFIFLFSLASYAQAGIQSIHVHEVHQLFNKLQAGQQENAPIKMAKQLSEIIHDDALFESHIIGSNKTAASKHGYLLAESFQNPDQNGHYIISSKADFIDNSYAEKEQLKTIHIHDIDMNGGRDIAVADISIQKQNRYDEGITAKSRCIAYLTKDYIGTLQIHRMDCNTNTL